MKPIGKIIHYYDKLGVAIVRLSGALKVGDKIKVEGNKNEFEQTVDSIQMDHKEITTGEVGQEVGIKLNQKANEGALIIKLEE